MKFIPILFSTPMVQAILNGTKVQTRRVVKGMALDWLNSEFTPEFVASKENHLCPYGQVGDVLWVRETFVKYPVKGKNGLEYEFEYKVDETPVKFRWKPGIHMPKEACRLFLKITDIRVERLHDISEHDAIAEGISKYGPFGEYRGAKHPSGGSMQFRAYSKASRAFQCVWESIKGEESWNSNPWVCVITFERIDKPENFI